MSSISGSADKKMQSHCRIIDYIDQHYPAVSDLLRATCVDIYLNPSSDGKTFLVPDKNELSKIDKLAYSSNVEDAKQAEKLLQSCIMRVGIKNASDWKSVPNSNYPSMEISAVSNGKSIKFSNGATAVLDEKFVDRSHKTNLAVWILTGEIPQSDKPADLKKSKKSKKGGYDYKNDTSDRVKIMVALENKYQQGNINVFTESLKSLLNFLCENHKEVLTKVIPVISCDDISLYFLIEPFSKDNFLIDNSIINSWVEYNKNANKQLQSIDSIIEAAKQYCECACCKKTQDVINEVDSIRKKLICSDPKNHISLIDKYYKELINENKIGKINDVYPKELIVYFQNKDKEFKKHMDEIRYVAHEIFRKCEWSEINYFLDKASDTIRDNSTLVLKDPRNYIQPNEKYAEILRFINSSALYNIVTPKSNVIGGYKKM